MQIVRSTQGPARVAVAAGFDLGARPPTLSAAQQDLCSALTHRAFAGALDQAARAGCHAFVCAGALFAEPDPALEHVRAVMGPLRAARRGGMSVVAVAEPQAGGGIGFLADAELIDAALDAHSQDAVLVAAPGMTIGVVTSGAALRPAGADLTLMLAPPGAAAAESSFGAAAADVIVDARTPNRAHPRPQAPPVIESGWAGPHHAPGTDPGFVILDLHADGRIAPTPVATEALRAGRLVVDVSQLADDDPGGAILETLGAASDAAAIVDLELRGRLEQSAWQALDPQRLIERAARRGALLRLQLDGLRVDPAGNGAPERSSFLVNVRRAAERLTRAARDDDERQIVAEARAHVIEVVRRRDPAQAVAPSAGQTGGAS